MSKQDNSAQAALSSASRGGDEQKSAHATDALEGDGEQELLPSDMNEATDISPRIAFLAYN